MSAVYRPLTALPMETLPDTFVHPAGFCQNVLATGACWVSGTADVAGREAVVLDCDHPRTIEIWADRPDHHLQVSFDRETGLIVRLVETIGGAATRDADGRRPRARCAAAAVGVRIQLPDRDDPDLLTTRVGPVHASAIGVGATGARRTSRTRMVDPATQPTTVNGLKLYLDEVGWQVDTSTLTGYTGTENVRVTNDATQAHVYSELVHDAACDPQIAEVNIFGFYDDGPRDSGFQAALNHVDGTPRASAAAVQSAIADSVTGCAGSSTSWVPAKRVIGAVAPTWAIGPTRQTIRFAAAADEGADVVACLIPGTHGGVATAALMANRTATSRGCRGGKVMPMHPLAFKIRRALPLRPATVALRLVAETSKKRFNTYSRTLR